MWLRVTAEVEVPDVDTLDSAEAWTYRVIGNEFSDHANIDCEVIYPPA